MKDKKRRIELFSFFDYTGIARHLTKMAEKGWLIEKMSSFGWTYRRIKPQKLHFFVSYYPKASEFDPEPGEGQKQFQDFCAHTGWICAMTCAQMQVFYNSRENPAPIETEPELELEMIHAAAKKSYLPSHALLLLLSLLNGGLFVQTLLDNPIRLLASASSLFTGFAWLMVFLLCIHETGGYFWWLKKARQAAARGEFPDSKSRILLQKIIGAAVLAGFAYWLATVFACASPLLKITCISMLCYTFAVILLVNGIKQLLKRKKVSRNVNRTVTFVSSFVFSAVLLAGITSGILYASANGLLYGKHDTYEHNGATFPIYQDNLPLTVQDLQQLPVPESEEYIRARSSSESLLAAQYEMWQHPRYDSTHISQLPELKYTITDIRLPFLYSLCKESLLKAKKDDISDGQAFANHYEPSDPSPWLAQDAYRLRWSSGYIDHYLLCYENRIVEIQFSWEPDPEQMTAAGRILAEYSTKKFKNM